MGDVERLLEAICTSVSATRVASFWSLPSFLSLVLIYSSFPRHFNRTRCSLSVNLTEHQIHRANNGDGVGKQVAARHLVEAAQVGEARCADLAAVRPLGAVGDDEDTHLTLGGFDGAVSLTRRDSVALGVEQEVVDQSLHVLLHCGARRRGNLVVLNLDGASGHLVQALVDDAEGLTELLHTAEVTVVAVTVDADGNVELNLVVGVVRLGLADIPGDTGTAEHDTREGVVEGVGSADDTNTLGTANPDTVVGQELLGLVDTVTELGGPLVDVVKKTNGEILRNATRADVGGVKTGTRDTLVEFLICISPEVIRHDF